MPNKPRYFRRLGASRRQGFGRVSKKFSEIKKEPLKKIIYKDSLFIKEVYFESVLNIFPRKTDKFLTFYVGEI